MRPPPWRRRCASRVSDAGPTKCSMLSPSSLNRWRFGLGDEATDRIPRGGRPRLRWGEMTLQGYDDNEGPSSSHRWRFALGDEAPERIPRGDRPRLRPDAGVDDNEDACERPPDPPEELLWRQSLDRREVILGVVSRLLASRSAAESHGAMDGEAYSSDSPRPSPARPRPRRAHRWPEIAENYISCTMIF